MSPGAFSLMNNILRAGSKHIGILSAIGQKTWSSHSSWPVERRNSSFGMEKLSDRLDKMVPPAAAWGESVAE